MASVRRRRAEEGRSNQSRKSDCKDGSDQGDAKEEDGDDLHRVLPRSLLSSQADPDVDDEDDEGDDDAEDVEDDARQG